MQLTCLAGTDPYIYSNIPLPFSKIRQVVIANLADLRYSSSSQNHSCPSGMKPTALYWYYTVTLHRRVWYILQQGSLRDRNEFLLLTSEQTPGVNGVVRVHVAEMLQQWHKQQLVLDGRSELHKFLRPVGNPQLRRHIWFWKRTVRRMNLALSTHLFT